MVSGCQTLVDGHVHIHSCFDPHEFLQGAAENFARAAQQRGLHPWRGCLLLADGSQHDSLPRLRKAKTAGQLPGWQMQPTDEPHSMLGRRSDGVEISLIAGWQIVTSERLEVLVLCCPRPAIPDGLPFQATLGEAMQADGVTVVPWGFGKWWFGRGRLVSDMMTQHGSAIFLGDNRGRPRSGIVPRQFTLAHREGIRLLPGTDPLPFPSQVDHAGRFGFLVPQIVDRSRPAENIKRLIRDGRQPECYGQRQSLPQFCQHQLTLRWSRMCRRLSA